MGCTPRSTAQLQACAALRPGAGAQVAPARQESPSCFLLPAAGCLTAVAPGARQPIDAAVLALQDTLTTSLYALANAFGDGLAKVLPLGWRCLCADEGERCWTMSCQECWAGTMYGPVEKEGTNHLARLPFCRC